MMNEDRIFQKLDALEGKTTEVLVGLARLEEQIKDVPDLRARVASLEKWRYMTTGSLAVAITSLITAWKGQA